MLEILNSYKSDYGIITNNDNEKSIIRLYNKDSFNHAREYYYYNTDREKSYFIENALIIVYGDNSIMVTGKECRWHFSWVERQLKDFELSRYKSYKTKEIKKIKFSFKKGFYKSYKTINYLPGKNTYNEENIKPEFNIMARNWIIEDYRGLDNYLHSFYNKI